eukprot:6466304-Amphidinium_carterae.4
MPQGAQDQIPVPPYMGYFLVPVHSSSEGRQQRDLTAAQMDDSVREAGPCEAHPRGGRRHREADRVEAHPWGETWKV